MMRHIFFLTIYCWVFSLSGIPGELVALIKTLVAHNPGQLTFHEYSMIAEIVLKRAPCSMLVFGVGRDSSLWISCNKNGTTTFLEDIPKWLDYAKKANPTIDVHQVTYGTRRKNWQEMLNNPNRNVLQLELPAFIRQKKWDIIFVDGPAGADPISPGRMKSIYMASVFAAEHHNVDIFVHDCNRVVENIYCRYFLHDWNLKKQIARLRHYHIT